MILHDIELLTIKLWRVVASVDRTRERDINWRQHDPALNSNTDNLTQENRQLRSRLAELE